jgi:fido (protein-threonine AMPylation protein)
VTSSLNVPSSSWLNAILAEVDELAAVVASADTGHVTGLVDGARDRAAVATMQLDGSPLDGVPDDIPPPPPGLVTGPARGGWLEVLRSGAGELHTVPDAVLMAIEHRGARAGLDALDLAGSLRSDLRGTLTLLHRRVTDGLLHPDVAGAIRRSDQAVNDASIGRVIFFPVDPAHIEQRFDALAAWVASTDAHPVVVSGVVHHQLLDIHPWEAANGRTARIAARLLLAADGVDAQLIAQPESSITEDVIGYLDDVGRSRRLGTPAVFVARWAEALSDGLRAAASELGVHLEVEVPAATTAFLRSRGATPFTIVDHRTATTGGRDADADLTTALAAGTARRLHGTNGLRWVATTA